MHLKHRISFVSSISAAVWADLLSSIHARLMQLAATAASCRGLEVRTAHCSRGAGRQVRGSMVLRVHCISLQTASKSCQETHTNRICLLVRCCMENGAGSPSVRPKALPESPGRTPQQVEALHPKRAYPARPAAALVRLSGAAIWLDL